MITYKEGCLVEALASGEVDAIGHQANCMNTMGSGVARVIRDRYPVAYEADCNTVSGDPNKLGSLSFVIVPIEGGAPGWIFNLYGQYDYGRKPGKVYTDLEALSSALAQMRLFLDASGVTVVGFPKLGAGLGGAKWADVETLLELHFGDLDVTVFVK